MDVPPPATVLVGRDAAVDRIRGLLARTAEGEGAVELFVGEPGSGKTTLLAVARELAAAAGFTVVSCRGVEWEAEFPFSGLHELLLPALGDLPALPAPQRAALEGALGLAEADDPQALNVYAGALSLLTESTRRGPVLIVVDDLHWMDSTTVLALAFVARRLGGEALGMIVATRPGTDFAGIDGPAVPLEPLDEASVAELACRHLGSPLLVDAARALAAASAGNPLAVVETIRHFGDELGLRGSLLDEPLPVGALIERGFADRLAALPAGARSALDVVATSVSSDAAMLHAALERLGLTPGALEVAEQGGVIELASGRVAFAHPLLRSLVYRQMERARLRACHGVLAAVAADEGLRAWHAASAATAADESIAADLEAAAERFFRRGGHLAAAQAMRRAADLSPAPDARARRLARGARAAHLALRGEWATEMLDEAARLATTPETKLQVEFHQATTDANFFAGASGGARHLAVARAAAGVDPTLEVHALRVAVIEGIVSGHGAVLGDALDALRGVDPGTITNELAACEREEAIAVATLITGAGGTYAEAAAALRDVFARRLEIGDDSSMTAGSYEHVAEALVWIGEFRLSERGTDTIAVAARRDGDAIALVGGLWVDGYRRFREGDWDGASASLAEAARLSALGNVPWQDSVVRATAALVQAGRGDASIREALPQIVARAQTADFEYIVSYAESALGLLELGAGRGAESAAHLEAARSWTLEAGQREPGILSWPIDLVDAYLVAGDRDRAAVALEELREHSRFTNLPWHLAAVERLDGQFADGDTYEDHFRRALDLYAATGTPFEEARAHLAFGRRLRRARRRVDARAHLTAALETFERLGAEPWAAQARVEMGASAATARTGPSFDSSELTPQEQQVAALVIAGATNKEVAGGMFLSPKTIETHLSRIYRKLGVTSRTQLAARMRDEQAGD